MEEIAYRVRGFLTIRGNSLRVPVSGSLKVHSDPTSGLFTGDFALGQSDVSRIVLGARLVHATVQITPESPVIGHIDAEGRLFATVTVNAVITRLEAGGQTLISGDSCRTATHAVVPLRSAAGFDMKQGGRLAGTYYRPPFRGCGWITSVINLLASGPGNSAVIDLLPESQATDLT
jgi:hypothetical protein